MAIETTEPLYRAEGNDVLLKTPYSLVTICTVTNLMQPSDALATLIAKLLNEETQVKVVAKKESI